MNSVWLFFVSKHMNRELSSYDRSIQLMNLFKSLLKEQATLLSLLIDRRPTSLLFDSIMLFLDLVSEIEKKKAISRLFEFLGILNYSNSIINFFIFFWLSSLLYLLFLQITGKPECRSSYGQNKKDIFYWVLSLR